MTQRIGLAITTALAENRMSMTALAREVGMSPDGVSRSARGLRVPTLETAVRMAEVLGEPAIVSAVIAARGKRCATCDAAFVDTDRANKSRCCSDRCAATRYNREKRDLRRAEQQGTIRLFRNRLTSHQKAVRAFCMACTGRTMLCQQPSCELRPVSPARLERRNVA
jgi:transcriptional regulator with XRE-family HTH domain